MSKRGEATANKRVTVGRGMARFRLTLSAGLLVAGLLVAMLAAPFAQSHPGHADSREGARSLGERLDCGYDPRGADDEWSNHRLNARGRTMRAGSISLTSQAAQAAGPSVEDVDNVAVVQNDGTIVIPPSKFNLKNSSILFTPEGDGYRISQADIGLTSPTGNAFGYFLGADGLLGNADNGYRDIILPGAWFPFFGVYYNTIYIGTNGYITFTQGDTTARISPTALAIDLPRIAPLWADLDVENSGEIYYDRLDGRHLVTWSRAGQPSYEGASTFQAVLYDDGRIAFVYKKVKARASMVGISPGRWERDPQPIDFLNPPVEKVTGPIFETFAKEKRLDLPALMRAFYRTHSDSFDTAYVWTEFDFDKPLHSFNVRNHIGGIGLKMFDYGSVYGSEARLSSMITLGNQADWPRDPEAHVVGLNSAISIVCHELGHRWLAYVHFDAEHDIKDDLLGRENAHWSFLADTRTSADGSSSSLMEGNAWRDAPSGTSTTIQSAVNYFTPLDQYLMGLRAADEVGEIPYLVTDADLKAVLRAKSPATGFSVTAVRKTTSVDQIAAREGPRVPDAASAPKEFRVSFILLTERGSTPASATLEKIAAYRDSLVGYFSKATGKRGSLVASLAP